LRSAIGEIRFNHRQLYIQLANIRRKVMKKLRITNKNDFFTYFEMDGVDGKFRMSKQIWNAENIAMMIQGPSWDGNGINGFGKRHLLSTQGGTHEGNPEAKARSILTKRQGGLGGASRTNKQKDMISAFSPKPANMKEESVRNTYNKRLENTKAGFEKGYPLSAYGPQTTICTFVLLDSLSPEEAAGYFARPIVLAGMVDGAAAHIKVTFPDPIVINAENNSATTHFYSINVSVKRVGAIYHIYHCNGAEDPA
jgi:hypothetical protein